MYQFEIFLSLFTLIVLEIILGIDNLIFLIILANKLPNESRARARQIGLTLAWVTRLILLFSAVWIAGMEKPLFEVFQLKISARDIFLLAGGIFLLAKATGEIHYEMVYPGGSHKDAPSVKGATFNAVVFQIGLMDIIFSLDSVLTAVALTKHFWVMALAITIAIIVMIAVSGPVGKFIEKHPTIKMLALSFLILIGTVLVADGLGFHIPRGYIYFSITFSLAVEALNIIRNERLKKRKSKPKVKKK